MYDQKDIVLIPFPFSDLTISKKRPALIISNDKINKTEDRICCLVTSKIHKDDIIISKSSFEIGSLPFRSSIKPHRIFTIHKKIIIKKLCSINNSIYDSVIKKLNGYFERKVVN